MYNENKLWDGPVNLVGGGGGGGEGGVKECLLSNFFAAIIGLQFLFCACALQIFML